MKTRNSQPVIVLVIMASLLLAAISTVGFVMTLGGWL